MFVFLIFVLGSTSEWANQGLGGPKRGARFRTKINGNIVFPRFCLSHAVLSSVGVSRGGQGTFRIPGAPLPCTGESDGGKAAAPRSSGPGKVLVR